MRYFFKFADSPCDRKRGSLTILLLVKSKVLVKSRYDRHLASERRWHCLTRKELCTDSIEGRIVFEVEVVLVCLVFGAVRVSSK